MKKPIVLAAVVLLSAGASMTAQAADEHNTVPGLTAAGAPLGLHGVDPVAFVELGNRLEGNAVHTAIHDGVAYYFVSEANLKAFEKSPGRRCSWANGCVVCEGPKGNAVAIPAWMTDQAVCAGLSVGAPVVSRTITSVDNTISCGGAAIVPTVSSNSLPPATPDSYKD